MRTTTQGVCRICSHSWVVPRTRTEPQDVVTLPNGMSAFKGLPECCPACASYRISYPFDQQEEGAAIVPGSGTLGPRSKVTPASTQRVLDQIIAKLRANPRRTMRPGGPKA